jgi:DNA polymerase III epsilon subunit-like protein
MCPYYFFMTDKQVYCSLDIETSDFDPANGEVLEVGLVFFEYDRGKIKITGEWESTFKPSKEVSPRILALTGITMEELDASPLFRDKAEELQGLVKDCIIVGHNISFDTKFLEGFGITFSGRSIDTLHLAQMFLPTNTSYNLEAMMDFFNVDHKNAHRALADAKASLVVMERMLQYYSSFGDETRKSLVQLFETGKHTDISEILSWKLKPIKIKSAQPKVEVVESSSVTDSLKENRMIATFPLGFNHHSYVLGSLQKSKEKYLLVVPNKKMLYELWRQDLVYPLFSNKDVFNPEAFNNVFKDAHSLDERIFFAKVLVWQATNWQSKSVVDINNNYGYALMQQIVYPQSGQQAWPLETDSKIVAVDYSDFVNLDLVKKYSKRKVVILDLNNFEQGLTLLTSAKVSWNDFQFALKQLLESATYAENAEGIKAAEQALSDVDLFFALVSMNIPKMAEIAANLYVNEEVENSHAYQTIRKASEGLREKLKVANAILNSERIQRYIEHLEIFFKSDPEKVHWFEAYESRISLFSSPLTLNKIAEEKLKPFSKIVFTASLGSDSLVKYFVSRLNLEDFPIVPIGQQELAKKIEVYLMPGYQDKSKLLELVRSLQSPAALVVANQTTLRDFYEDNFKNLQDQFKVLAQGYSGGANKLIQNFNIHDNGLLIATDNFILKQSGKKLEVKNLILGRIPFELFTHPLFAAQAKTYSNEFIDHTIPRALYNFHSLIRFFYSDKLEKIYILDSKIKKDYGSYFIEYLRSLPFVEIKE